MAASPPEPRSDADRRPSGHVRPALPRGLPLLALGLALLLAKTSSAQDPPRLSGRVLRGSDSTGVAATTVVLHLVTPDTAGEVGSIRTGPSGEFSFRVPTVPDPLGRGEVYLASVTHEGVLYFGPAVHQPEQLDSVYLISVYDTSMVSEDDELPVPLRYLILEPAGTVWSVTDVIQVENPGTTTLVAPEGEPVWRYPLPEGATGMQVVWADSPEAVRMSDGHIEVRAPIPPGVAQYSVAYQLPSAELDMALPGRVRQVELLVREPAPPLNVTGLVANLPAEMDVGVTYARYSGVDVQDGRVRVVPGTAPRQIPFAPLALMMAFLLAAVTLWALQRGASAPALAGARAPVTDVERRERLLLELAELDERLEGGPPEREARLLSSRRAGLLEALRRLG